jgi:Uma2 family endonuclease
MAETDLHRDLMFMAIETLQARYALDPQVYVSGNLLVFYIKGDRLRHVSPDVFVVKGVPKRRRDNYLIWEEGKGPDIVFEFTSKSTREEDIDDKFSLYRDKLKVPEYFLFDPTGDYLKPNLRGYRLVQGEYVPIEPVAGRLPSEVLGLHVEQVGSELRFYDPATAQYLPTNQERLNQETTARQHAEADRHRSEAARHKAEAERQSSEEARRKAEAERQSSEEARHKAEAERQSSEEARHKAEAEVERLRREIEELRHRSTPPDASGGDAARQ